MTSRGYGHIYFLRAGADGPIKVGFSVDLTRRLANLQQGHYEELRLLGTAVAHYFDERRLHTALASDRIRSEWYRPTPRVLAAVAAFTKQEVAA